MTRFVLDTDTCVFWLRGHRGIEQRIVQTGIQHVAITVITACELAYGVWKSSRRVDNLRALERLQQRIITLHTSEGVAALFGRWKAQLEETGAGLDDADLLIGAMTHLQGATLVTNNQAHFGRLSELTLENWLK